MCSKNNNETEWVDLCFYEFIFGVVISRPAYNVITSRVGPRVEKVRFLKTRKNGGCDEACLADFTGSPGDDSTSRTVGAVCQ